MNSLLGWFTRGTREHWVGIIISLLVGVVIAAPAVIWRTSAGYKGIPLLKQNTESHYIAQVQEVYEGDFGLGNPFLGGELKKAPYLFPPLSPLLLGIFGKLTGLSATDFIMVFRFFATSLLAFFIYLLSFAVSGRKTVGWVAAPFAMLAYALVDPGHIVDLLNPSGWSQEKTFIDYGRPTNPQISSLFFFGYLLALWNYIRDTSKKYLGVLSTVILGLSFYVYLYTWSFALVFNGILFLFFVWRKDWVHVKRLVYITIGAIVIGIPYLAHTYASTLHPLYAETSPRFGFFHSRAPELSRLSIIAIILYALGRKLLTTEGKTFFLVALVTAIVTVNEQIITGLYIFNHHWHWYYVTPLVIIFLTTLLFASLERISWGRKAYPFMACFLIFVFFYNGTVTQRISYATFLPVVTDEQRYAPMFEWLRSQTTKQATVFASNDAMSLIPAVTSANVYYHGTGIYTLVSTKQLLHTYLVNTYLKGIPSAEIRSYLEKNRDDISHFAFGYTYRLKTGICLGCFPDEILNEMAREYQRMTEKTFISFLREYPVDYVIWDKKNQPSWSFDRFGARKIMEKNEVVLYEL